MIHFFAMLFLFIIFLMSAIQSTLAGSCNCTLSPVDLSVLNELYISFNGSEWTYGGASSGSVCMAWNFSTYKQNPCTDNWCGVTCGVLNLNAYECPPIDHDCYVIELDVNDFNLIGTIPPEIWTLNSLQTLNISSNSIIGNSRC